MAVYRDYYEIELYANDRLIDIIPNSYGFAMTDSIHKLFATGTFYLNDETGLLQEYMGTDQGVKVTLDYGTKEKTNKNHYVVLGNSLQNPSTSKYISGEVEISLKHEWFNFQDRRSTSFDDRISQIVKRLVSGYGFNNIDVNDSQNRDYWYQANRTQSEFIKEVLLPRAYSTNAAGTPFFAYITSDNVFHFRNLQSMYNQNPEFKYIYDPTRFHKQTDTDQKFLINDLVKWQTDWDNTTKDQRQIDFYFVEKDGSVKKASTERLIQHVGGGAAIPILNEQGNTTDVKTWFFQNGRVTDNDKGKINDSFRENLFIDRFLITVPLNPYLQSGKKIEVEFKKQQEDGVGISERYSGDYIIEMCSHVWNKEESRGETQVLIGRGATTIPANYLFGQKATRS
jgi:hypothetical protein